MVAKLTVQPFSALSPCSRNKRLVGLTCQLFPGPHGTGMRGSLKKKVLLTKREGCQANKNNSLDSLLGESQEHCPCRSPLICLQSEFSLPIILSYCPPSRTFSHSTAHTCIHKELWTLNFSSKIPDLVIKVASWVQWPPEASGVDREKKEAKEFLMN